MTWTGRIVGASMLLAAACQLSVGQPEDPFGTSGASGVFDSEHGGSGGQAGSAGSVSMSVAGDAGATATYDAGSGDSGLIPTPTCSAEPSDAQDACIQCIKQNCCSAWQACNDSSCQKERSDLVQCVSALQVPDSDGYGDCVSASSTAMDGFLQTNTETLMDCVNEVIPAGDSGVETTRCGTPCFGVDIFFSP